jgi:hypothetical protein
MFGARTAVRIIRMPVARASASKGVAKLVVAVANQEPRRRTEGRRVTKLLRDPGLRREARRRREHNLACGEVDEYEREDRAEEHVVSLKKVAGPDLWGVVS